MTEGDTSTEASAALLWDEARRQVERQESSLESLKTRAIVMLSVSALVAGFFGSHLPANHDARVVWGTIAALVLFAGTVLAALYVLTPRWRAWGFSSFLRKFFDRIEQDRLRPMDVTYGLATRFEGYRIKNKEKLEELYEWMTVICLLVGLQVVAWVVVVV